jgi:hypothetical protein
MKRNQILFRDMIRISIALLLFCTLETLAQQKQTQSIPLSNKILSLEFSKTAGKPTVLFDKTTGMNFISEPDGKTSIWQIDMLPGTEPAVITPEMAGSFRWEYPAGRKDQVRLIWEKFTLPYTQPLQVIATITLNAKEPTSTWTISISKPGELQVEKVHFPRISGITKQTDERLAAPIWMGEMTKIPREVINGPSNALKRLEWPYPGTMSLQCLAFYKENGPGLYLSCDDTAAFRKAFAFWGDSTGRVNYEMFHYPENEATPQTRYAPAYGAVIGTFTGDWITAAERYRAWGTRQPWAVRSRLNLGLVPDWLLKTSLWVWNRDKLEGVLPPAVDLQNELKQPVSVFWHWWHGCSYDDGFPEYLPPRDGTENFKSALAMAHKSNVRAIVYMNQRLWGMTTKSWLERGAEKFAVKGLDGKVRPEIYNTYTQKACATMCMATSFWRDTYAGIAQEAVRDLDVDGIYMDQACSSLLCYDPAHGHSLGGGTFWMNGFRLLSNDIRARTKAVKQTLLAGEGAGEAWLPYLDLMLTLQVSKERYARPNNGWHVIPFFQAVYHSYGITYGNYSSLTIPPYDQLWPAEYAPKEPLKLLDRKYASQFYIEQARTFAWGSQPTICNYRPSQRTERNDEIAFVLKLAKVRQHGLKFLQYGTFMRPPNVTLNDISFTVSRINIYAGRQGKPTAETKKKPNSDDGIDDSGKDKGDTSWESTSPPFITGAWKAKDGALGVAAVNVATLKLPFTVDASRYGFRAGDRVTCIDERGRNSFGVVPANGLVTIDVPSREAYIIELAKK